MDLKIGQFEAAVKPFSHNSSGSFLLDDETKDLLCEDIYYKTKSFKIVQDTEESLISVYFQTGVSFSSWSRDLKLKILLKIVGQRDLHLLDLWSPREECTNIVNNFTRRIQQSLLLNGKHLKHVIWGFLKYF